MVGLGRMGGNMAERLRSAGHEVVGYANDGSGDVQSLDELVKALSAPRTVWLMVPAGSATHSTVQSLAELLEADDLVIDGGNSKFTDDTVHAELLGEHGIRYVDCGVSGGVWGRTEGYGLMAGGDPADIERLLPVFDALRPEGPREEGFVHAGPVGAGHYAKMVHNGVEYGLMQAYAEGYELLSAGGELPVEVCARFCLERRMLVQLHPDTWVVVFETDVLPGRPLHHFRASCRVVVHELFGERLHFRIGRFRHGQLARLNHDRAQPGGMFDEGLVALGEQPVLGEVVRVVVH